MIRVVVLVDDPWAAARMAGDLVSVELAAMNGVDGRVAIAITGEVGAVDSALNRLGFDPADVRQA